MMMEPPATVLRNAHVIDPEQNIDGIADVHVADGKIAAIGKLPPIPGVETIDLAGHYLSPGWIDAHVHVYGTLGFADPDSIGIWQGVTTYVDAGGPGIGSLDEFMATMEGLETTLYAGAFIRPIGIIGLSYIEDEIRGLDNVPVAAWLDFVAEHPGLIRYLKMGAFNEWGGGPLKIGKGLAETLGVPLYVHIGEFRATEEARSLQAFRVAERGDMITHLYHENAGNILDENGRVLDIVRDAERRGVLFDIGFGGNNFSWRVAETAYAQGVIPNIISSDLQQFNVTGPAYSLAHVLSIFHRLGMSVQQIVERVTANPAKALGLRDSAGSLRVGMPADITVFRWEEGQFEFSDSLGKRRSAAQQIKPVMAFKAGRRFDCDLERCQDERNWLMTVGDDVPESAHDLTASQRAFLASFVGALDGLDWDAGAQERLDLAKAALIKAVLENVRRQHGLGIKEALRAVYDAFIERRFSIQIGLFLMRLERTFALDRLRQVAEARPLAA
jgi:dihydroorotase